MKKITALMLALCICLSLVACKNEKAKNEEVTNQEQTVPENVVAVEAAIDKIGTVTFESQDLIDAANNAYNALSDEEKSLVRNATVLADAMVTYMTVASRWEIRHYTDEFGDETEDGYLVGQFTGEFSNTATVNSDLTVGVYVMPSPYYKSGYMISFRLLEYSNHIATYTKYDLLNLTFKVNGETYGVELVGIAPNGDLGLTDHNSYEDKNLKTHNNTDRTTAFYAFLNALKDNSGEISCLITIGDMDNIRTSVGGSTYRFKINGNGLAQKLAELEG